MGFGWPNVHIMPGGIQQAHGVEYMRHHLASAQFSLQALSTQTSCMSRVHRFHRTIYAQGSAHGAILHVIRTRVILVPVITRAWISGES